MATFDSTATLPLKTGTTNVPAPRPDGKNLLINIDVGTATYHCQPVEHVGTHKNRYVGFQPDEHCWVIFTNEAVFGKKQVELFPNKEDTRNNLHVADGFVGETYYTITDAPITGPAGVAGVAEKPTPVPKSPPQDCGAVEPRTRARPVRLGSFKPAVATQFLLASRSSR